MWKSILRYDWTYFENVSIFVLFSCRQVDDLLWQELIASSAGGEYTFEGWIVSRNTNASTRYEEQTNCQEKYQYFSKVTIGQNRVVNSTEKIHRDEILEHPETQTRYF